MEPEKDNQSIIEELQALDDATKRKIMAIATCLVMVVVVYAWFGYFNGLITNNTKAEVADSQPVQASGGNSFFQNVKKDTADIGQGFKGMVGWLISTLQGPGQYTIHPQGK